MTQKEIATIDVGTDIQNFDPEKTLQTIVIAEASEPHWTRAKDPEKLFKAIEAKITAQAEYVVWRDRKVQRGRPKIKISDQKSLLPAADPGAVVAHRWRRTFCLKGETGTIIDKDKMALALDDAKARALRIVECEKNVRGTEGTGENEWYTPKKYIDLARSVLGEIDLDPASSKIAQKVVKAKQYFTIKDNGLTKEWHGNIWLNPPYAQPYIEQFADKMIEEFKANRVMAAIMLTHNYTDTKWFQKLAAVAAGICFTDGRIKFESPNGEIAAPTQGQAFFFFGPTPTKFMHVFASIGFVGSVWHG